MSAFGWLTKGRCEVSLLDILTLCGELVLLVVGIFIIYSAYSKFIKK